MEEILPLRYCTSVAVLMLDTNSVYMIPTTNKIIQLSPSGLQQAITIRLTLSVTIYHIAQMLHFVDASFEKKWLSRLIFRTQKHTSQESLYLNEIKYDNNVLNTFTNKCCNFGANQKCQMVAREWFEIRRKKTEKPYDGI